MKAVREHFVAYGLRILLCEREVAVALSTFHPERLVIEFYNGLETGLIFFCPPFMGLGFFSMPLVIDSVAATTLPRRGAARLERP
jgi:hypothetical protein